MKIPTYRYCQIGVKTASLQQIYRYIQSMQPTQKYNAQQKMSLLIGDNYSLLMVMSRFGISLGFGDKTVEEVCREQEIDCDTFLTIANFVSQDPATLQTQGYSFSLQALMDYLKSSHSYFLDFRLPAMRHKLEAAVGNSPLTTRILHFFDDYAKEVRLHMDLEEDIVFGYVGNLLNGQADTQYNIEFFNSHHDEISSRLTDLKNILIKYLPEEGNHNLLNQVLYDIYSGEADISWHCRIEDYLFIPAVAQLECKIKGIEPDSHKLLAACPCYTSHDNEQSAEPSRDSQQVLSQREQDIVRCVAMGMTNKEMADYLYISVHTVITHRRNIAQKLEIHSPAGLTIYAIVNKIVDVNELHAV